MGATFVCEEGNLGIGRISLRKKSSMSVDLQRWQACQDIEQPLATTEPAHGLVKIQGFDLRRLIRRAF
jgi:hypothetical protein